MILNYTDEINYSKSCLHLIIMSWVCVGIVLFADTLTVFIDAQYLSKTVFFTIFKTYVLMPGILNILTVAIVHILSYFLLKKKKYIWQACLYIIGMTFVCFILAMYNKDLSINLIFFIVPIMLALFYLDRKLLVFSLIVSIAAFAANVLIRLSDSGKEVNQTMLPITIEVSIVIMVITFITGMIVIGRLESVHKAAKEADEKSKEDALTGYLNHSGFYDDLDETFKNMDGKKGEFSLALIDIDNFSYINEEYGRGFGDEVLEVMVACINRSLVNAAKVYRYGGEEFVIICNGQQEIVINMVDSILREFKNKTELKLGIAVTSSAGICEYDPSLFNGKRDIFAAVDEALYVAKRLGKNQYAVWNEAIVRNSFVTSNKVIEAENFHEPYKYGKLKI